jgi:hypothetical protein
MSESKLASFFASLESNFPLRRNPECKHALVQDVDDPISPRVDKNGSTVDYGVPIVAYSVLWRNIVICNLSAGQNSSYRKAVSVVVGWMMLTAYIFMEAWALINPEQSFDSSGDSTDDSAHNGTHWAGGGVSFSGTLCRTPWHTLC